MPVMCFAYTNEIPKNVEEYADKFSHDAFLQSAQRDQNVGHKNSLNCIYSLVLLKKIVVQQN